jgi:tetratricopeptide (TPR) repeat protein
MRQLVVLTRHELNQDESAALTHKGIAISKFGAYSEAIDYIDRALQINPYDYAALTWKGKYLETQKDDLYAAIRYYNEALEINPQDYIIKAKRKIALRKIEVERYESY